MERYTDKLAKYILISAGIGIICALLWFFRSVLAYILIAVVVSLIAKPMMNGLNKISIKGKKAPNWLIASLSLILVTGSILAIILLIIPLVSGIVKDVSMTNLEATVKSMATPLADLNIYLRESFPSLGSDFRLEIAIAQEMQKLFSVSAFSSIIGSAASVITDIAIGLFSVIFIAFFFIKDDGLFTNIVCALVPDKHEKTTEKALNDIEHLLSRYFIGVIFEIIGVASINFLGLWLVARLGINAALGIAFLTGILNVIPYVGPLMGIIMGTALGLMIAPAGMGFWALTAILIAVLFFTQLVDNFLYQPLIYSTSIKSKPLEIFIVLLIVGHIGGPLAMIVAIPIYTVFRVVSFRFFRRYKAIQRLIPSERLISDNE